LADMDLWKTSGVQVAASKLGVEPRNDQAGSGTPHRGSSQHPEARKTALSAILRPRAARFQGL
jgi:hypothetical protein